MKRPDRGLRRLVVKVKRHSKTQPKRIPRKLFLGIRLKGDPAALCPLLKVEDEG